MRAHRKRRYFQKTRAVFARSLIQTWASLPAASASRAASTAVEQSLFLIQISAVDSLAERDHPSRLAAASADLKLHDHALFRSLTTTAVTAGVIPFRNTLSQTELSPKMPLE